AYVIAQVTARAGLTETKLPAPQRSSPMAQQPQVRQFAGDIRMWETAEDGSLVPVIPDATDPYGNQPIEVNSLNFGYEAGDEISVKSRRRDNRYNQPIYSDQLPGTTSASLQFLEMPTAIMARVLRGEAANA